VARGGLAKDSTCRFACRLWVMPCCSEFGNGMLIALTVLTWYLFSTWSALTTGVVLAALQLFWQAWLKRCQVRDGNCNTGWLVIINATHKSQWTALYLYCQHFSRYYSIFIGFTSLLLFPGLLSLCLSMQLLPALVQYKIKKPPLDMIRFIVYFVLEDLFYQAGVYSGCIQQKNWRPLGFKLIRAGGNEQ